MASLHYWWTACVHSDRHSEFFQRGRRGPGPDLRRVVWDCPTNLIRCPRLRVPSGAGVVSTDGTRQTAFTLSDSSGTGRKRRAEAETTVIGTVRLRKPRNGDATTFAGSSSRALYSQGSVTGFGCRHELHRWSPMTSTSRPTISTTTTSTTSRTSIRHLTQQQHDVHPETPILSDSIPKDDLHLRTTN